MATRCVCSCTESPAGMRNSGSFQAPGLSHICGSELGKNCEGVMYRLPALSITRLTRTSPKVIS